MSESPHNYTLSLYPTLTLAFSVSSFAQHKVDPKIKSAEYSIEAMLSVFQTLFLGQQKSQILRLPPEIILEILTYLSVLSKACLVLSCKRFYCEFGYFLELSLLEYPYSDGLDSTTDLLVRRQLLLNLQTNSWSRQSWTYCVACIKLHPQSEFQYEEFHKWLKNGLRKKYCKWPGIIILCPCVKFTPKRITEILYELRNSKSPNKASPESIKCLPNWHYCELPDSSDELAYSLAISISLEERTVVFHLEYSISLSGLYLGKKRIMLCPHRNALNYLNVRIMCPRLERPSLLNCSECGIEPSITLTTDTNRYRIQYTRKYAEYPSGWYNIYNYSYLDRFSDYRWDRYFATSPRPDELLTDKHFRPSKPYR